MSKMNQYRIAKDTLIAETNTKLKDAETVIVVQNKGLTVAEVSGLRRRMRDSGAEFKVVKNRLVKRALSDTRYAAIEPMLKGPTALATSKDPVSVAKNIVDFVKTNEKLVIIGGAYGDRALDLKGIEALSKLPSLNELRGKIIGLLQAPATKIACVLQAPAGQVARVIGAHARQG